MALWNTEIPPTDPQWQQITLSAKQRDGANVRTSPMTGFLNNVAGRVLHKDAQDTPVLGVANKAHEYYDGIYHWLPVRIFHESLSGYPLLWVAQEAFVLEFGDIIKPVPSLPEDDNNPYLYFDVLDNGFTVRMTEETRQLVVNVLHALAYALEHTQGRE